jgi:hypothetical protein
MFHLIDTFPDQEAKYPEGTTMQAENRAENRAGNQIATQLAWGAMLVLASMASPGHAAAPAPVLPDRLLECSIGHVINFDPTHQQTAAELRYDGFHRLVIMLAQGPRLVGKPPEAIDDAPAVDPRTHIVADPDHITAQPDDRFGRIIDQWPNRVELSATIKGDLLNAIVLTPIDEASGMANLFMMRATELTHFDPAHIYQGTCRIRTGAGITL